MAAFMNEGPNNSLLCRRNAQYTELVGLADCLNGFFTLLVCAKFNNFC